MLKDDKAMLVLFKSKQQMISMVDLGLESLKVEQHSTNVITVLDSQGRAWSLQMLDENFIKTYPYHLLSMRYSVFKNGKIVSFSIDKGENKNPVKIGDSYHAEIFCGCNFPHMKMIQMKKVKVEPNVSMWHHHLTNYHENARLLLYGAKSDFTDVPMKEDRDTDCVYLMIKLNGKVVSPPTSENEVLVNKMEKIGKNVMINVKKAEKMEKPKNNSIESQIESNHQIDTTTSTSKDVKIENPTRDNIKNNEPPAGKISDYPVTNCGKQDEVGKKLTTTDEISNLKMNTTKDFRDTDMIHMLMSEFRLQNTEMRISMLKLHDKIDQMGIAAAKTSEKSVVPAVVDHPAVDHSEVQIKKAMNRLYKHIKTEIRPSEEYKGQDILDLVASCIKSTTESILENKATNNQ